MKHVFLANINHFDLHRIGTLLTKKKIEFFVKTSYESSVTAGWMSPGASFNEKILFVDELKLDEARKVLKKQIEDYHD